MFVTVEATRDDTYVKIGDLKVRSRRLPGRYTTMFAPCPEDIKIGGRPEGRYVNIDLGESPKVQILDEEDRELDHLGLALKKGDEGSTLDFYASVEEDGVAYEWWVELTTTAEGIQQTFRLPETGTFKAAGLPPDRQVWSDLPQPHACKISPDEECPKGL